ncbi:hypothetical protein BDV34DRAFT_146598 [Aspergillus parasiticus]|uniref:Uncharacterized protein n=1 Tax=Aspergillus parasiticus TaxID=5067 RepID=A0A5N6DCI5_ASPPA|nr:hypothetical protein BDV34DRAFT_146598 [Aspergillus parasiticus]
MFYRLNNYSPTTGVPCLPQLPKYHPPQGCPAGRRRIEKGGDTPPDRLLDTKLPCEQQDGIES